MSNAGGSNDNNIGGKVSTLPLPGTGRAAWENISWDAMMSDDFDFAAKGGALPAKEDGGAMGAFQSKKSAFQSDHKSAGEKSESSEASETSESSEASESSESGDSDVKVGSKRRRLDPAEAERYLAARRMSDLNRGDNVNVARVRDAQWMRLFDEWFWLVYIGCRGIYDYRQLSAGHKEQCAERALHQHRAAIVQQQSERWRREFERSSCAGQKAAAARARFGATLVAFNTLNSNVKAERANTEEWCRRHVGVLQWYADYFGCPVVLVHRGKGWCAEFLPRGCEFPAPTHPINEHALELQSNAVVLYMSEDTPPPVGAAQQQQRQQQQQQKDAPTRWRFGVELAPERARRARWTSQVVRVDDATTMQPLCAMSLYTTAELAALCRRVLSAQAALFAANTTTAAGGPATARHRALAASAVALLDSSQSTKRRVYDSLNKELLLF
jgi:hypothetical protein